jgi:hypothetical protein
MTQRKYVNLSLKIKKIYWISKYVWIGSWEEFHGTHKNYLKEQLHSYELVVQTMCCSHMEIHMVVLISLTEFRGSWKIIIKTDKSE